jgi:putative tributyrin esterase
LIDLSVVHVIRLKREPSKKRLGRCGSLLGAGAGCLAMLFALALASCGKKPQEPPDHPRLTAGVTMVDVRFYSNALGREMPYRIIFPTKLSAGKKLPVLYLLHGGGGGFRDWSNYSDVAGYAEKGLILVMLEGNSSYYVNSADHPRDRYEDYITRDLIADVEGKFPAATGRANRAIAGVSMGGFGALVLALKHPDLFGFAGGLSSALDVPSRPFSIKRLGQWRQHRSIFGPKGGQHQRENDPLTLVRSAAPENTPYFFLTCGDQDGLLPTNRQFAALLQQRHFKHEFHTSPGGHDWNQWNSHVPALIDSLTKHLIVK